MWVIRLALIVVDPATRGTDVAGGEVATPVQILDLMPRILARAGVPVPAGIDARSLTRPMRAEELADQLRGLRVQADRLRQHRVDLREQRERLRALGYVAEGRAEVPSPSTDTERKRP